MKTADDAIESGLTSHARGDFSAAQAAYGEALLLEPDNPDALNLMGVAHVQLDQLPEAIRLIRRAIEIDPEAGDFYSNLGEALRKNGQSAEAAEAYARATELDPENASAWANLAMLLQLSLQYGEAARAWTMATQLTPSPDYFNNLGLSLSHLARYPEAVAAYDAALALKPDLPSAIENRAIALNCGGKFEEAVETAKRLATLRPGETKPLLFLAAIANDGGRFHDAIDACRDVLRIDAACVDAHFALGYALNRMGESGAAVIAYSRVAELQPGSASVQMNLGLSVMSVGDVKGAVDAFTRATEADPSVAEPWFNLAIACERLNNVPKAIEAALRSREARPYWAASTNLLASLYLKAGDHLQAEREFRHALELDPQFVPALAGIANMFADRSQHAQAIDYIDQALRLAPTDTSAHDVLLMALTSAPGIDRRLIFEKHLEYGRRFSRPIPRHNNSPNPTRRIRVGYISPDFRAHSVAFFLIALFGKHDHSAFEIVAYDDAVKPDSITQLLKAYCDQWHRVLGMPDNVLADLITSHEIDILVDLTGHTASNRLTVLARKPAPIQVSYVGYPNTTGLTAMDYRLTDAEVDPPGDADAFYTEKLVRLPGSFLAYSPAPHAPELVPPPVLRKGHITFASFNAATKLHTEIFRLWADVLHAVPGSKLMLKANGLADPILHDRIVDEFQGFGIEQDRLMLVARAPDFVQHMAMYGECDIALDSFPYNGTTTTCEAMWMGLPVVTLAGTMHAGRVGVSLLKSMGLPDCIAQTPEEYVRIAARLAGDPDQLAGLRAGMRDRMTRSPLMDGTGVTRNVEAAFKNMWADYCVARQNDVDLGPQPTDRRTLLVEGWRFSMHSYAVVNQAQCLEIKRLETERGPSLDLYFHDLPFFSPAWKQLRGSLPPFDEQVIDSLRPLPAGRRPDAVYRIAVPLDCTPHPTAERTYVFATIEFPGQKLVATRNHSPIEHLRDTADIQFITPSHWSKRGLVQAGAKPQQVLVVPHGVDTHTFKPLSPDARATLRQKYSLNGFVFMSVGAMTTNKGMNLLLQSFAKIHARNPDVTLLLKGMDSLYDSRRLLESAFGCLSQNDALRIQPNVRYIGGAFKLQDMAQLYGAADAYVSPYNGEGFNLPVLEAIACNVPVICTDGGATDDFTLPQCTRRIRSSPANEISMGRPVEIIQPDAEHLLQLMLDVMEQDSAAMCAQARHFVEENFTWPAVTRQLLAAMGLTDDAPRSIAAATSSLA